MMPNTDIDATVYLAARKKYNPLALNQAIKFLLIGESPPVNGAHFYRKPNTD
jgi:hypothetical protein